MTNSNPIDTVLDAEKDATAAIEAERQKARQRIKDALSKGRAISERANQRVLTLHSRSADTVKAKCDAMWQAYEHEPSPLMEKVLSPENLNQVLNNVATKLTCVSPKSGGGDG